MKFRHPARLKVEKQPEQSTDKEGQHTEESSRSGGLIGGYGNRRTHMASPKRKGCEVVRGC